MTEEDAAPSDAGPADDEEATTAEEATTDGEEPSTVADEPTDPQEKILEMYQQSPIDNPEGGQSLTTPVGEDDSEPERITGTFYVKYVTESSATLHEINTEQICTLVDNPGLENHEIIEATLVAQPPMEVSYLVEELDAQYSIPVERSPEPPTRKVKRIAADMDEMEAVAFEREGAGEIHVLRTASDAVEQTAEELLEDEMTYKNAARYGIDRVEIRTDDEGIVSIRYLP